MNVGSQYNKWYYATWNDCFELWKLLFQFVYGYHSLTYEQNPEWIVTLELVGYNKKL